MDSAKIKEAVMRQVQLESNTSNARMLIEVRPPGLLHYVPCAS